MQSAPFSQYGSLHKTILAPYGIINHYQRYKERKGMNATGRICLFCGIGMGIVTILLLTSGRNAQVRSLEFTRFTPLVASSVLPALPVFFFPLRQAGNKERHRSASDGPDPESAVFLTAFGLNRLFFSSGLRARIAFFRHKGHIPGLREIRGMLPFSLAPPLAVS